jgi:hypothetical protein
VAWLVGLLELPGEDLVQADRRDEDGVLVEELVYLLENPLRFHWHVVEVHLPQQGRAQLIHPLDPRARLPRRRHVVGYLQHRLEGQLGVGDHGEVGPEDPPELARVYVYVDEPALPAVHVQITCVPLGPAIADSHYEVAL